MPVSDESLPIPPSPRVRPQEKPAKPPLNADVIARTALELIDEDGVDALSMRKVAERLGTGAASLYAHVANKDVLLDLVYNRVVAELDVPQPDPDDWEGAFKQMMRNQRALLRSHRDIAKVSLARIPTGAEAMPVMEKMMALLRASGLPDDILGLAPDLMSLYVDATAYEETLYDDDLTDDQVADYSRQLHEYFAALPEDRFPNLREMAGHLTRQEEPDNDDLRFEFGIEVIVRGMKAVAEDRAKGRS